MKREEIEALAAVTGRTVEEIERYNETARQAEEALPEEAKERLQMWRRYMVEIGNDETVLHSFFWAHALSHAAGALTEISGELSSSILLRAASTARQSEMELVVAKIFGTDLPGMDEIRKLIDSMEA